MASTDAQTGYAPVGDLNMYYEIHGRSRPTLLLHGASMTIDLWDRSQLAVLPGTAHYAPLGSGLLDRGEWLLAMLPPFLDAPEPEGS